MASSKPKIQVMKRNKTFQELDERKFTKSLENRRGDLEVDIVEITTKVLSGLYDKVSTSEINSLTAETAAYMSTLHTDYAYYASRIAISSLYKNTSPIFSETIEKLHLYVEERSGLKSPIISESLYNIVKENAELINSKIVHERDFQYDYFGFKTLERSYLLKINKVPIERPQHMLMRVSLGIHGKDFEKAFETYEHLSNFWFTHASPTLFNAGTVRPQLSSCFLLTMVDDSIEGIYETLKRCSLISKAAGGIGIAVSDIRTTGSYIRGTNGLSNGIVPMLRVFNNTARYVDQGGAKRPGAFAIYLETWHNEILEFLDLKKNTGKEEVRARDLFYGLWISDLFMKRVESNSKWSLFCPNEARGLSDVWGEEFEKLYEKYEQEGKATKVVNAQDIWFAILAAQIETGTPYMLYKDACNRKSNQQNLGTIKCSNLCTEIVEYTSPDEIAVCNLASISLPRFISTDNEGKSIFDHQKLRQVTSIITRNLNKIIDINYYPVEQAKYSNIKHRPIGIGVQGLADTFIKMRYPFDSDESKQLNKEIFETIYFSALETSNQLSIEEGPYSTFKGSPASKGVLQFDMWNVKPSPRWDWETLRENIKSKGLRNSLLVAPMPTASTSQILGNNECIEPYTSNIYSRRVLSGEFTIINKHLVKDLMKLNLWSTELKDQIIRDNGSIQNIDEIPNNIKSLYKTVWEIKQKSLVDMAADRGAFIDQSQSFNVFLGQPTLGQLTSMHFYGWKKGLKTGMYYLRTQPAARAIQFTLQKTQSTKQQPKQTETPALNETPTKKRKYAEDAQVCTMEAGCLMCGS